MRLTTLARKIQITPSKLVAFLEQNKIEIDNGINTRLDDEAISMVMKHFDYESPKIESNPEDLDQESPDISSEEVTTPVEEKVEENNNARQEKPSDDIELPNEEDVSNVQELSDMKAAEPKIGTIDDLEEGLAKDIDLIKAKKVKLEGIKVIGKIELPEKQKKEISKEAKADSETTNKPEESKKTQSKKQQRPPKKDKNSKRSGLTISYEEKLKREERIKRRELKLKMNEEKARKREHYLKKVQAKSTSSLSTKKKKKQTQQEYSGQKITVVHKNPIKRFWAWLNGAYDKY
jgi:hypothetical protein